MTYCVCDEKSPCLYHKEKGMSQEVKPLMPYCGFCGKEECEGHAVNPNEVIHYDLEQTLREARRESGMTLESIASVIDEVLDAGELDALIENLYERLQSRTKNGDSKSNGA